jgi:hypothetical protein
VATAVKIVSREFDKVVIAVVTVVVIATTVAIAVAVITPATENLTL